MYKEYLELYRTYTQKYGSNTAIFLMVGSFYELYDIQDTETGTTLCNIREIVDLLGIQLSTKKGDVEVPEYKSSDGLFAGFPEYVMHKWAGRLTSAGWTVVIVDQIKDVRGKVKERKVSRILSPSTHIENIPSADTPYVITLYLEMYLDRPPYFGISALDLTTGTTHTYSGSTKGRPDIWTADEMIQFMGIFSPKELIVYFKGPSIDEFTLRRICHIVPSIPLRIYPIQDTGSFTKTLASTEYLQRVYRIKSLLPVSTYLGLREPQEQLALLYLLQFAEEHYPSMIQAFHRNEPWIPYMRLICGNHALTQLQLTGTNPDETIIGLFDKVISPMGKRAIRQRLLSPYSDSHEIRTRLREVEDYLSWPEHVIKGLERQLRFMYDLPRLHRKILCGLITSQEIATLFITYSAIHTIMTMIKGTCLEAPFTEEDWLTYVRVFHMNFTEDKMTSADITPFNVVTYVEIGLKEKEIHDMIFQIQQLRLQFVQLGGVHDDAVRLEVREREPYGFKASTITIQHLKKNIKNLPEGTKWTELKSGGWIDCTALQHLNIKLQRLRDQLRLLSQTYLVDACQEIATGGQQIWSLMESWIAHVDVTQCIGRVSHERGWSKPVIEEGGSCFAIKQIRHPLVEASKNNRVAYVQHDISLDDVTKGWLVYGMNASGKSTLMKATGICILLAQAGCFVPAKEMTLTPFKAIYTRILNQDNLFAGLSSFAVEMSELRDILHHATPSTLVLGDEMCAGTESVSAQALVASGIQWLTAKGAKFIFATHLHDLPSMIPLDHVKVWHLHVDYDPITKKLVYDRSLRPGNGSTLYGLEVARAMDLPMEFIEQALAFRHKLTHTVTQEAATSSSWNQEIVRRTCEVCKNPMVKELEVHHVHARRLAQSNRLPDGTLMNHAQNLMVICQVCHDAIHRDELMVEDMKMTSDGPERVVHALSPVKRKSKWSEEEQEVIRNTLQTYPLLSLKAIKARLESKHEIVISTTALSTFKNFF